MVQWLAAPKKAPRQSVKLRGHKVYAMQEEMLYSYAREVNVYVGKTVHGSTYAAMQGSSPN